MNGSCPLILQHLVGKTSTKETYSCELMEKCTPYDRLDKGERRRMCFLNEEAISDTCRFYLSHSVEKERRIDEAQAKELSLSQLRGRLRDGEFESIVGLAFGTHCHEYLAQMLGKKAPELAKVMGSRESGNNA